MEIPFKKLKTNFAMPDYGLGTWRMGGGHEHDPNNDDEADIRAIQEAIDNGVTHIDTAEIYADGHSEEIVGKAIKKYDRAKLFIVSKADDSHFRHDDLLRACKNSLGRLDTPYLDLYLLHSYTDEVPLKETISAMDALVSQGLVKNIGVSNFGAEHLKEAQDYSENKIVCDQVHYNLQYREPEKDGLLEYCQKNGIFLVAWRPVRASFLKDVPDILQKMAEKYGKTPVQIAINWLVSQPYVVTLSKTRNLEHLKENLGGVGWKMDDADIELIRKEFPDQKYISDVVPLG